MVTGTLHLDKSCDFFKPSSDTAILKPPHREGSGIIKILIAFPFISPMTSQGPPLANASVSWRTSKPFDGMHTD